MLLLISLPIRKRHGSSQDEFESKDRIWNVHEKAQLAFVAERGLYEQLLVEAHQHEYS